MKLLVLLAFGAILGSLGAALFFMMRGGIDPSGPGEAARKKTNPMAKALALRVGVSIVLFLTILLAWKLGWIQPTGLGAP